MIFLREWYRDKAEHEMPSSLL